MTLTSLYRPTSLAVVGASPTSFVGRIALENSRRLGFTGPLIPVTPRHREVCGLPAVPSLLDLPNQVDTALVQVRADRVIGVVEQGIEAGLRNFVVPGAGATDSGDIAHAVVSELQRLRTTHGITVVGPNCMGVLDLVTGAAPYIGTAELGLRSGGVGVIAQSGAVIEAFVNAGPRVPLSTAISSGSEAVLSMADHLTFLAHDPHTRAVLLFVEAVDDAAGLLAAVGTAVQNGTDVVACVVGRSAVAQEGVLAHSGKLAGAARIAATALQQAGAVLAHDLDELLAFGEILGTRRSPTGTRTHLVTNSGGEANLLADVAADVGLQLPPLRPQTAAALADRWPLFHPRNPLDPWGTDEYTAIYPTALQAMAAEGGDLLVVGIDQQTTAGQYEKDLGLFLATSLRDAVAGTPTMPVMLSPASQDPPAELAAFCAEHDIPLLRGARPALAALAALASRTAPTCSSTADPVGPRIPRADLPRTEDAALAALAQRGLQVPWALRVSDAPAAVAAFAQLLGPVVLKGVAEGLLHKTEADLVRVGLTTEAEVQEQAERMLDWASDHDVELDLLVVELVRGDLEVLVGFHRDPVFGPTCLVGLGGVWAEFLDVVDVHVGLLDEPSAAAFLGSTRVGAMLAGARGGALHSAGVVDALCAVSALGAASPDIQSIDVNPVIVDRTRAVAVDAAVTLLPSPSRTTPREDPR